MHSNWKHISKQTCIYAHTTLETTVVHGNGRNDAWDASATHILVCTLARFRVLSLFHTYRSDDDVDAKPRPSDPKPMKGRSELQVFEVSQEKVEMEKVRFHRLRIHAYVCTDT